MLHRWGRRLATWHSQPDTSSLQLWSRRLHSSTSAPPSTSDRKRKLRDYGAPLHHPGLANHCVMSDSERKSKRKRPKLDQLRPWGVVKWGSHRRRQWTERWSEKLREALESAFQQLLATIASCAACAVVVWLARSCRGHDALGVSVEFGSVRVDI